MLVALFSVTTTLFTVGLPLLRSRDADVIFIYEHSSKDKDTLLIRNDGLSGALVRVHSFEITKHGKQKAFLQLPQSDAVYVASDKEEKTTIQGPPLGQLDIVARMFISDSDFVRVFGQIAFDKLGPRIGAGVTNDDFKKYYSEFRCLFRASQKSLYREVQIQSKELPCWDVTWIQTELLRIGTAAIN